MDIGALPSEIDFTGPMPREICARNLEWLDFRIGAGLLQHRDRAEACIDGDAFLDGSAPAHDGASSSSQSDLGCCLDVSPSAIVSAR